ncbi:unnamed protein product [Thlaspi arvense]|uniref:Terpene synthase N-terminal domain-containing protein n=1 Tax=Thlaspi arvense TaxID=13288 RepID=A0AAU9RWF7_THLAR|nr:unnamed protein product [Thlaspi arvense]
MYQCKAYAKEVELLKGQVRNILLVGSGNKLVEKILLINTLERLGVSYHFEEEIEELLQLMFANFQDDSIDNSNLFTTSVQFRIFRQHGYRIPSSVFNKFKGTNGKFKESLIQDVTGMLSLYEAAYVGTHGEDILDEALAFSKTHLLLMLPSLNPNLANQVKRALHRCLHRSMPRLEARHYISFYEKDPSRDDLLLRFAKVDYNLLQLLHKQEFVMSQGGGMKWKFLLNFLMQKRPTECYFWSSFAYFEPHYSFARVILAKVIMVMTLLDDTYDAYGTFEELKQYTNAVERWDAVDLPEYLTLVFGVLANLHEELEFKDLARAYELEIKWVEDGYAPTMEEYFANGIATSTGTLLLASFVGMGEFAKVDAFDWLRANPRIAVASAIVGRLINDLASSEREQERGHIAGALECYMKEFDLSKQDAIDEIYRRIDDGWKDINEEILRPTTVSMHLLMRILNITRSVDALYKDGEAFTHQQILKDKMELLYLNPIPVC